MILMPESGSAVVKSQGHLGNAGLVLPASSFMNGAVLVVDGGMLAQNHLASLRDSAT